MNRTYQEPKFLEAINKTGARIQRLIKSGELNLRKWHIAHPEEEKVLLNLMSKKAQLPEARAKKKETFKRIGHQQGEKNSQFGTMWITNGIESKKIQKDEVIPEGWALGRIFKTNKGRQFSWENNAFAQHRGLFKPGSIHQII